MRSEGQQVRLLADCRKSSLAKELNRRHALEPTEVQLDELHETREVRDHQDALVVIGADEGQDARIVGAQKLDGPASKRLEALAHGDEPPNPPEQRMAVAFLRFD